MNKCNFIKEKLYSGKAVLGTWSIIPSVELADIIASSGVDFIIIDSEHGPINFETAQRMAIACESREVSPIMRISSINENDILKALDIGMHGIQIPNISCKKDVEEIINFAKYPPIGNRGFSPFTRSGDYIPNDVKNLTMESNKNTLIGINIEDIDAINNIDEILSVKSLDIIFVGIFDLSKSMGIPGEVDNPKITKIEVHKFEYIVSNSPSPFGLTPLGTKNKPLKLIGDFFNS